MDGWIDGWVDGQTDRQRDGWMNKHILNMNLSPVEYGTFT